MKDLESFIKEAREVHGETYDYSKVLYTNCDTPVCIICPQHGEFWLTPYHHVKRKLSCPKCRGMYKTTEEYVAQVKAIHGDKYDYSKIVYTKALDYIIVSCKKHGDFKIKAYSFLSGVGCHKCANEMKSLHQKQKARNTFVEKARKIHGDKYDYSKVDYQGKDKLVTIICPIHGEFLQKPHEHLAGNGCQLCGRKTVSDKLSDTLEEFLQKAHAIHGYTYDYSQVEYVNWLTPVKIICRKHGPFFQTPRLHIGQSCGCSKCKLKSQTRLFLFLTQDIPEAEFLFEVNNRVVPWLKKMRLDIYSAKYNIAIEYDGLLHFIPIKFGPTQTDLHRTQQADIKKNVLCELNGCKLFRIPYNYTDILYNDIVLKIKQIIKDS